MKAPNAPGDTSGRGSPPVRVVPDANVLFPDPFLRGFGPQAITTAGKFVDISLAIADITCDELRNLVKTNVDNTASEVKRVIGRAESLGLQTGANLWSLGYASKQAVEAWETRLAGLRKTLPSLPYPELGARDLAQHSIGRHRPFLEGDKGLRDFLLWVSVLVAAQNDQCTYVLVSGDHCFYAGDSDTLHPDLTTELAEKGLSGRIVARKSFAKVVDEFVKPFLNPEQSVEVAIRSGSISDFTDKDDAVAIVISEYLLRTEIPDDWITRGDSYGAEFDVVEDATMTDLTSVLNLDGKVLVTSEWEATVVVNLSFPGYHTDSESIIVDFTVESLVNATTLEVESHEVSEANLSGWYDEQGQRVPC